MKRIYSVVILLAILLLGNVWLHYKQKEVEFFYTCNGTGWTKEDLARLDEKERIRIQQWMGNPFFGTASTPVRNAPRKFAAEEQGVDAPPPTTTNDVLAYSTRLLYRQPCPEINEKEELARINALPKEQRTKELAAFEEKCNFNKAVENHMLHLQDRDDFLHMESCYMGSVNTFQMLQSISRFVNYPLRTFTIDTAHFRDVRTNILKEIEAVAQRTPDRRIMGPCYALVFQVPDYKDSSGRVISLMNQNIEDYRFMPYNLFTEEPVDILSKMVRFHVALFFPMHKRDGEVASNRTMVDVVCMLRGLFENKSRDPLCFIRCPGEVRDSDTSYCGCKNQAGKSRCLGPGTEQVLVDYGIVYKINPKSPLVINLFHP